MLAVFVTTCNMEVVCAEDCIPDVSVPSVLFPGNLLTSAITTLVMAVSSHAAVKNKMVTPHADIFSGNFKDMIGSVLTLFAKEQDWVIHADPPSGMCVI